MLGPVIHTLQLHGGKFAAPEPQLLHEVLAAISQGECLNTRHTRLRLYLNDERLALPAGALVRNTPGGRYDTDSAWSEASYSTTVVQREAVRSLTNGQVVGARKIGHQYSQHRGMGVGIIVIAVHDL